MSKTKLSRTCSLFITLVVSALPTLASASPMKSIVTCTPLQVREWPQNVISEVLEDISTGKLLMRWESSYYGFVIRSETKVERTTTSDGIDTFIGTNASLAVTLDASLGEYEATFDSDKDGPQTQRCIYNDPSL